MTSKQAHALHTFSPINQENAIMKQHAEDASENHANDPSSAPARLDPVVGVGLELSSLWRKYEDTDAAAVTAHQEGNTREENRQRRAHARCYDSIQAHHGYLGALRARSIPGALIQGLMVYAELDLMQGNEEIDENIARRLKTMLSSINAVLRQHACGIDPLSPIYVSAFDSE